MDAGNFLDLSIKISKPTIQRATMLMNGITKKMKFLLCQGESCCCLLQKKNCEGREGKKTANFSSILSNMERHERLNEIDQNKEAAAAAQSNTDSPAEEERRSILLMKYIVDNFKRKSQSKNLLAKSTLDWVENVQTCVSKYA